VGFKIFPDHNDKIMWGLIEEPSIKKIILVRENYLMNYLSFLTAQETNLYFVKAGTDVKVEDIPIKVDFNSFLRYEKNNKAFFDKVRKTLTDSGQEFFEVHYEDLLVRDQQAEVLRYIGVNPDPDVLIIKSVKQNKLSLDQKIINYKEIVEKFTGAGKADYLREEKLDRDQVNL
jgi:hypothetical protein